MQKNVKIGIVAGGMVLAAVTWAAHSELGSSYGDGTRKYCVRLLGPHGTPVASKDIETSADDDARRLAGIYLNEHDKGLSRDSSQLAFPFVALEGHPCDAQELRFSSEITPPMLYRRHYRHSPRRGGLLD